MPDESQEIEQLNIDITATNEKATAKIEEVKKSLSSLKRAITNFGKLDMSGFEQSIGKISDSLGGLKGATKNLSDIKNRLNDVSRAVPKIADLDTTRAEGNINKLTVSVKHLAQQCERLAKSDIVGTLRDLSKINFSRLDGVTRKTKKKQQEMSTALVPVMKGELVPVGKPYYSGTRPEYKPRNFNVASTAEIEELRAWAKKHKEEQDKIFSQQQKDAKKHATETNKFRAQEDKARKGLLDSVTNYKKQEEKRVKEQKKLLKNYTAPVKNILKSFGRIAFYRLVRSIIKIITDSIKQGIGMAYSFSSENGGQFSKTMDNLTTSINYLRSSLGSLISNVLIALEPLITNLINGSVDFINNLSQAFAYMAKQDTWLKAIRVESEYSDVATGVAAANKKLKQSFLGIDEINVLGDTQQKLFDYEVVPVDKEEAKKTSDTLKGLATSISAIAVGLEAIKVTGTITKLLGITGGTASTISGVSSALAGSGVGAAAGGLSGAITTVAGAISALVAAMKLFDNLGKGADDALDDPDVKKKLYDAGKTGDKWNIFWTGFAESWDAWWKDNGLLWNPIFGVMQGIFGGQAALNWQEDAAKGYDEYIRDYYDEKRKRDFSTKIVYDSSSVGVSPFPDLNDQNLLDALNSAIREAASGITINIDGKKVSDSVTVNQKSGGRRTGNVVSVVY